MGADLRVVVTDLKVASALNNFVSRMLNTLIGCVMALGFLKFAGASAWVVLLAMARVDDCLGRPGEGADQLADCADYGGDCDDSGVCVALRPMRG